MAESPEACTLRMQAHLPSAAPDSTQAVLSSANASAQRRHCVTLQHEE